MYNRPSRLNALSTDFVRKYAPRASIITTELSHYNRRSFPTAESAPSDTVYIIILVVLIVVAVILVVAILTGFGVFAYCHSKRERLVRPAPMPRRVYPPPMAADESQTVTMPIEMIH